MPLSQSALLAILENLPVAVIVADRDGRIVFANAHSLETLGHSVDHIDSVAAFAFLHGISADGLPLPIEEYPLARALRGENVPPTDYRYQRPDGAEVWLRAAAAPIVGEQGIKGASVLFRNVDREKTAAAQLRAAERRLDMALSAGRLGAWTLDLTTLRLTCTSGCKANFGLPPTARFDYPDLLEAIHPDDRQRVRAAVDQAIATGAEYVCEYRAVWPDGSLHWIAARGLTEYNPDGVAATMDGVTAEITERRVLEETLREQAATLRDADRRKDQFLAALSHELRNPMAAMASAVQVLSLQRDQAESSSRALAVLGRQLAQMTRLVDDLLEVSRISEGKVDLQLQPVDAASFVAAAAETVRPRMEERRQTLTIDSAAQPVVVEGDAQRLTQVIVNLLTNASKYTDEGGDIVVTLRAAGASAEIAVRDTGIGIPLELQPHIFDLFMQVDAHRDRSEGGLGLGLSLVHRLTRLHGGSVAVRSDGPGHGTEFIVRLPLAQTTAGTP